MKTKICKSCSLEKELEFFSPKKKGKLGVNSKCKKCCSDEQTIRYKANPEFFKERARTYRKKNPENYRKIDKKYKDLNPKRKLLDGCRYRAKKNNLPCTINMEDIVIPDICPILGIEIKFSKNLVSDNSPSVDRIIPNLGYVKNNIKIISFKANRIKGHATLEELKTIIKYIEDAI